MCSSLRTQQTTLSIVKKELADVKVKLTEAQRQNSEQENKLTTQSQQLEEYNERIAQQDKQIADMNKKMLEYDQKFVDLMAEIARVTSANRPDNANFLPVSDSNGNPLACVGTEACTDTTDEYDNNISNNLRSTEDSNANSCRPVTRKRKASSDVSISAPTTRSAKSKKSK